jgi:hypothetical protein
VISFIDLGGDLDALTWWNPVADLYKDPHYLRCNYHFRVVKEFLEIVNLVAALAPPFMEDSVHMCIFTQHRIFHHVSESLKTLLILVHPVIEILMHLLIDVRPLKCKLILRVN